jgi:hypothetical protein
MGQVPANSHNGSTQERYVMPRSYMLQADSVITEHGRRIFKCKKKIHKEKQVFHITLASVIKSRISMHKSLRTEK